MARPAARFPEAGLALLAVGLFAGCAVNVSLRVPPVAIANLPLEQRVTLLDAENEMLASQDARDAADEAVATADEAIGHAERRLDTARKALDRASDPATQQVAKAGVHEAEERLKFAEQDRVLTRAKLATASANLLLAQAKFELARAHEVEVAGQGARYGVRAPDYQAQVDRIAAFVKERSDEEQKVKAETDGIHKEWDSAAQELAQLTGGAQGSIWVQ